MKKEFNNPEYWHEQLAKAEISSSSVSRRIIAYGEVMNEKAIYELRKVYHRIMFMKNSIENDETLTTTGRIIVLAQVDVINQQIMEQIKALKDEKS